MSILNVLRTSGSALTAQRLRMDVISSNIANAETTATAAGGPYKRERVLFAPLRTTDANSAFRRSSSSDAAPTNGGVEVRAIVEDDSPPRMVYDPSHPDSDEEGYVAFPNVDLVTEMTDMLSASRAYEANVTLINVARTMAQRALDLGRG